MTQCNDMCSPIYGRWCHGDAPELCTLVFGQCWTSDLVARLEADSKAFELRYAITLPKAGRL